jgi:hypothetical protein
MFVRLSRSLDSMKHALPRFVIIEHVKRILAEVETGIADFGRVFVNICFAFLELEPSALHIFVETLVAVDYR